MKTIVSMSKKGLFSSALDIKINFSKVNIGIICLWISMRLTQLLGFEDEIMNTYVENMLRESVTLGGGHKGN